MALFCWLHVRWAPQRDNDCCLSSLPLEATQLSLSLYVSVTSQVTISLQGVCLQANKSMCKPSKTMSGLPTTYHLTVMEGETLADVHCQIL